MKHDQSPTPSPQKSLCTRQSLTTDFQKLGLQAGSTILLHASLSSLGFVVGGAETVISALLDVLSPTGTLVVPTHSGDNSDPSEWTDPPVPKAWWPTIRYSTPAYDPRITRTRAVGVIPEMLRTWPGALRSGHPQTSFAALGSNAEYVTSDHALDSALGEKSPLARLEKLGARILLLGVGYDCCTAFHLAEYRVPHALMDNGFAVLTEYGREWMVVRDCRLDSSCFVQLGSDFELAASDRVVQGKVGDAHCKLVSMGPAVEFATEWMKNRQRDTIA